MKNIHRFAFLVWMACSSNAFAQLSPTPIKVNDWGSGFIASYEVVIQQSDLTDGVLNEWRVEVNNRGDSVIGLAWMEAGYRAGVSTFDSNDAFVLTNKGQDFIRPLNAGDAMSFSVLGTGAGYKEGDLSLRFIANNESGGNTGDSLVTTATFTGVADWYNPVWGGGFIASYECELIPDASEVSVEFNYTGSGKPGSSWPDNWFGETISGYVAPSGGFALVTNGEKASKPPSIAQFSIYVDDAGFSESDFNVKCISMDDKDNPPVQGCLINGTRVSTGLPQSQCDALVAVYNSTNGPGWNRPTEWLTASDPCVWDRVTCTTDLKSVERLNLFNMGLNGVIPPELGQLTDLRLLNLGYGQLSGTIPDELRNLVNLESFDIAGRTSSPNTLSGPIPSFLGNLTQLQMIRLSENNLSGPIPPELGGLSNLRALYIGESQVSGEIPPELGNIPNLRTLSFYNTPLTGTIPPELGNINSLEGLRISQTGVTGEIPAELGNIGSLTSLSLTQNQLTGAIPPALGSVPSLNIISLASNQLTGPIPVEFALNIQTVNLNFSDNELSGRIPPEFGQTPNLYFFDVSNNVLSGDVSTLIDTNLQQGVLRLRGNNCFSANSTAAAEISELDSEWQDGC